MDLKTKYPQIGAMLFPPKRLFGNRYEKIVIERRKHLEVWFETKFLFVQCLVSFYCALQKNLFGVSGLPQISDWSPGEKHGLHTASFQNESLLEANYAPVSRFLQERIVRNLEARHWIKLHSTHISAFCTNSNKWQSSGKLFFRET